jgi:N-methylhydantoinase B
MVEDIDELAGEKVELQLRQENFVQEPTDVYGVTWSAAGGFGDPMDRDPARVQEDAENGDVTAASARAIYGVVLGADGALDRAATDALRAETRAARVARHGGTVRRLAGPVVLQASEYVAIRLDGNAPHHTCSRCATDLGPLGRNYKDGCLREDNPISGANPHARDPGRFIDASPVFRQFFCPGCGGLIENEVATDDEPLLADIELHDLPPPPAKRQAAE